MYVSHIVFEIYICLVLCRIVLFFFFFSSRRRHTRSLCDWSSDVCSSDLGHGRMLMDHVLNEFRRRGFAEVALWVLEENRKARAFYEKYGFEPDGGTRRDPKTEVSEVRYRIRLNRG